MAIFQNESNKTKDGRSWYFSTYYVDLNGNKKKYKSKKYSLKKEAQEAERKFILTLTDKVDKSNINFKDLILEFDEYKKNHIKITSYENYPKMYRHLGSLNNIVVSSFNLAQFNLWKNEINNTNYSTTYKNNIYKFLRMILNWGNTYLNINTTPILHKMTNFKNPNELKKEMLFYTYDEFKRFISVEDNIKYKAYFETLYYCGLRKGEANSLNWNDIDLDKGTISITKNLSLKIKGQKFIVLPPKTKGSIRTLPMPNILKNDLFALFNEYKNYTNFDNKWFVFGGPLPLADTTMQVRRDRNCKLAGVKSIRIHDFRHSCASLLINNGASIALIAKYLGHSNISTTLNTYTHMFKNEFEDIIKTINNLEK